MEYLAVTAVVVNFWTTCQYLHFIQKTSSLLAARPFGSLKIHQSRKKRLFYTDFMNTQQKPKRRRYVISENYASGPGPNGFHLFTVNAIKDQVEKMHVAMELVRKWSVRLLWPYILAIKVLMNIAFQALYLYISVHFLIMVHIIRIWMRMISSLRTVLAWKPDRRT